MLKTKGFVLTPYKLVLLSIIKCVYKQHHKIDDGSNSEEIQVSPVTRKRQKEKNLLALLKLLGHVDEGLEFTTVYKHLEETEASKSSILCSVMNGLSAVVTYGTEGLTDLILDCENILLEETNGVVAISRNSVIGMFIRSMLLAFHRMTFSEKVKFVNQFKFYYQKKSANSVKLSERPGKLTPMLQKMKEDYLTVAVLSTHATLDRLQGENVNSKLPDKMGQGLLVLAKIYEHFGLTNEVAHCAREALISGQELHTNPLIEEAKKLLMLNGILSPKQLLQLRPSAFAHDKSGIFAIIAKLMEMYKDKAKLISILSSIKDRKHTADSKMELSKLWNTSDHTVLATLVENTLLVVPSSCKNTGIATKYGSCQLLYKLLSANAKHGSKISLAEDSEFELLKTVAKVEQMMSEGKRISANRLSEEISALLPNMGLHYLKESREGYGVLDYTSAEVSKISHVGLVSDKIPVTNAEALFAKHFLLCGNYGNAIWKISKDYNHITNSSELSNILAAAAILRACNLPTLALQCTVMSMAKPWTSPTDFADILFDKACSVVSSIVQTVYTEDLLDVIGELEACAAIYEKARSGFKLKDVYFLQAVAFHMLDLPEERNCAAKRFRDLDELHGNVDFAFVY